MEAKNKQMDIPQMCHQFRSKAVAQWVPPEGAESDAPPEGWLAAPLVTLDTFDRAMQELMAEVAQIQQLRKLNDVGVLLVDVTQLQADLLPGPTDRLSEMRVCALPPPPLLCSCASGTRSHPQRC